MPPPTKYGPNTPASPVAPAPKYGPNTPASPVAPAPTPVAPAPRYGPNTPASPAAPIEHRSPVVRRTPQGLVASLSDQLPLGYKNEAQSAASAYRKLNPKLNWPSDISNRALNRQVPVNYVSAVDDDPNTRGQYQPATDQISLKAGRNPKAMGSTLQHELTHAMQFSGNIPARRSPTMQPMLQKTMESQNYDPATAKSYSSYMTDPTEQEAYLAGLKRDHYVRTGKHIRTQDEARKMLIDLPNTPRNQDQHEEAGMEHLLRRPQQKDIPGADAARAQWIESLSKMMPGLVQRNPLTIDKTANFPGGNAMMPQPAPNGFNPNVFSHNNFSGTFPMNSALPAKPNPLTAAPQMGGVKADANGIQAAMAKRGAAKQAKHMALDQVPMGTGPQNMFNALSMLNQARTLVNPAETLKKHRLSHDDFESMATELANTEGDYYDFDTLRKSPKRNAVLLGLLGAGAGGVLGRLSGKGIGDTLGLATVGGLGGAGYGYGSASGHNRRLLGTSKVLRDYGLLRPDYLRAALPLLKKQGSQDNSAPRCSSAGESKGVGYKMDDEGHLTGGSAFGTLDKYMKKAGLNSFQAQFFGRLIQSGMDEAQMQRAVKQAQSQFGEKIASELSAGLEKLAGPLGFFGGLATKGLGHMARKFRPKAGTTAKQMTKNVLFNNDTVRGLATGAFNPYTGLMSDQVVDADGNWNYGNLLKSTVMGGVGGTAARVLPGPYRKMVANKQKQMMGGAGLGNLGARATNYMGYTDIDPTRAAQVAGGVATFLPSKIRGKSTSGVLDALDYGSPEGILRNGSELVSKATKKMTMPQAVLAGSVPASAALYTGLARAGSNAGAAVVKQPEMQSTLKKLNDTQQQVQQVADKINRFAAPFQDDKGQLDLMGGIRRQLGLGEGGTGFGAVGDYLRQNPQLASAGLMSLLGMGTGYMAGGARGAAMGGLSAPLLHYLAQSQFGGAAPAVAGTNQTQAPAAPPTAPGVGEFDKNRENEIVQQQLANPEVAQNMPPDATSPWDEELMRQQTSQYLTN